MYYKQAVKKNKDRNPKPIRLEIGKFEKFEGVEIESWMGDCCNCSDNDNDYNNWGCTFCDCPHPDNWLIIKRNQKYIDYFDMNEFTGENFKLYGETYGTNFHIIAKIEKKRKYKNFNTKIIYL
jgi:hypothetical protein